MKTKELIDLLSKMDPEAEVSFQRTTDEYDFEYNINIVEERSEGLTNNSVVLRTFWHL